MAVLIKIALCLMVVATALAKSIETPDQSTTSNRQPSTFVHDSCNCRNGLCTIAFGHDGFCVGASDTIALMKSINNKLDRVLQFQGDQPIADSKVDQENVLNLEEEAKKMQEGAAREEKAIQNSFDGQENVDTIIEEGKVELGETSRVLTTSVEQTTATLSRQQTSGSVSKAVNAHEQTTVTETPSDDNVMMINGTSAPSGDQNTTATQKSTGTNSPPRATSLPGTSVKLSTRAPTESVEDQTTSRGTSNESESTEIAEE